MASSIREKKFTTYVSRCFQVAAESNLNDDAKYRILFHSLLVFPTTTSWPNIQNFPSNSDFEVKEKIISRKDTYGMPKSSSGDLYWIENQYFMVNMDLKKGKIKTNIHHIMSVYRGLWKTFSCRQIFFLKSMIPHRNVAYNSKWSIYAAERFSVGHQRTFIKHN